MAGTIYITITHGHNNHKLCQQYALRWFAIVYECDVWLDAIHPSPRPASSYVWFREGRHRTYTDKGLEEKQVKACRDHIAEAPSVPTQSIRHAT
eukprot:SAG25_NODE_384_length_8785_cov_7.011628_6_plen_94_part_00